MPWSPVTVIEQRQEFVALARQPGANISQLCRCFQISRKTAYKWLARQDMSDLSRRPHTSPRRTDAAWQDAVLAVRDAHPAWGGRKIAHVLRREQHISLAPSTIHSILQRHGRISEQASAAATRWQRFEHQRPNALWQMDFKGHFALHSGRCHPLTVLDDHSRFAIVLHALPNEQRSSVQAVLQGAFQRFGLPDRINADNGPPWGNKGQGGLTRLAAWLIRLGVSIGYSRPAHPQTNGKDERFHRTLKAEVLSRQSFADIGHAQRRFDAWRHVYNHQRPHQALDMHTPASRYCASVRSMPAQLPPIEYLPGDWVRKVQQGGWIHFKGRELCISKALLGQPVALRPVHDCDGQFEVFFCHQKIQNLCLIEQH